MLELIVTACILGDPSQCIERTLPITEPAPMGRCLREGPFRAQLWVDEHPDLVLKKWRCADPARTEKPVEAAFGIEEVAPGVFVHPGRHETPTPANAGDLANIGFIVGQDAVAVVDAGGSAAVARKLLAAIRAETDLPVRWLILTHMHPDHTLGAGVFRDAGATVIGHAKLPRALATRAETYRDNIRRLIGEAMYRGSGVITPDEGVEGTRDIDLGERILRIEAHPTAHTDNDLTVLDVTTGTWFLGDLAFEGHLPALDGSITGWIDLLGGFEEREVARVVPGHGAASLDWPSGLAPTSGYLKAVAAETRAAIARGDTMVEAMRAVGESQREEGWHLFDEFHRRNVTAAYKELEWE